MPINLIKRRRENCTLWFSNHFPHSLRQPWTWVIISDYLVKSTLIKEMVPTQNCLQTSLCFLLSTEAKSLVFVCCDCTSNKSVNTCLLVDAICSLTCCLQATWKEKSGALRSPLIHTPPIPPLQMFWKPPIVFFFLYNLLYWFSAKCRIAFLIISLGWDILSHSNKESYVCRVIRTTGWRSWLWFLNAQHWKGPTHPALKSLLQKWLRPWRISA